MLKLVFPLILSLCWSPVIGQASKNDSPQAIHSLQNITKLETDTIRIQTVLEKPISKLWYQENNMPWIVALIIAILTVLINIGIARMNLKSTKRNLEAQIETSIAIANRQIDASKDAKLKEFKATLNTNNRQAWVTEVRDILTDLITQAKALNIEFQEKKLDIERQKILHDKITYNHVKLLLLLDPNKERHKPTLKNLVDFMKTLDKHLFASNAKERGEANVKYDNSEFLANMQKVVEEGRKLLYEEWGKIQTLL